MTDKEKNNSIEYILTQGLVKPPTFFECITKIHQVLGWKFIFWDFSYSLIFMAFTLSGIAFLFRHAPMDYQYSVALGFSPVLFLLIMLFAEMNERTCRLYDLKQTCRYTSQQITALRCIYYSLAGTVFTVIITFFSTESIVKFSRVLPVSLGGLFLCAAIGLSVIRLSRSSRWGIAIYGIAWVCINLTLPFTFGEDWELFLSGLPLVVTVVFMIAGAAIFMYQTNKMLTEEKSYAVA